MIEMNIKEISFRIQRRLRWEWYKHADGIRRLFLFVPIVLNSDETIEYVVTNHASLSRFGDGEMNMIYGSNLNFQKKDDRLGQRLSEVLSSSDDKLLVCIPDVFDDLNKYNTVERNFWRANLYYNRTKWYRFLKKGKIYGNAFISRFYAMEYNVDLASKRLQSLKRLWENRNVVFVEGIDTKMGVGNDLFDNAKSVKRILCPSKNSFECYDEILSASKEMNKDVLFIIALGPTATVLAYDLSKDGYQALDLGHLDIEYEWYKMKATSKVPIKGKFSNEAFILGNSKNEVTGKLESDKYEKEIVKRIGK